MNATIKLIWYALSIAVLNLTAISEVSATEQHESVIHRSADYTVSLNPRSGDAIQVTHRESGASYVIDQFALGLSNFPDEQLLASTAGLWWYKNTISFFGPNDRVFVIRLPNGVFVAVNLPDGSLLTLMPSYLRKYSQFRSKELAVQMLTSSSGFDRETGAIVCGQEQILESIPQLKALLRDHEYYETNQPIKWTKVYYVRDAAKESLIAMGEEPIPGPFISRPMVALIIVGAFVLVYVAMRRLWRSDGTNLELN